MMIRSKAPLRIGLAGGGTDTIPFSEQYGGYVLNATINLFAHCTIIPRKDGKIKITSIDSGKSQTLSSMEYLQCDDDLSLVKGVYNRIVKDFTKRRLSFEIVTRVDAPPGSGLGSSSTLVVAIIDAFTEWLNIPLGDYDKAHLAYEIERIDLQQEGGKQDQYAAAFGGVNFLEFYKNDRVIVNPLRINTNTINELNNNLVLYYTGVSRKSFSIIQNQNKNIINNKNKAIEGMNGLKEQAVLLKEFLLKNKLDNIGELLDLSWQSKKKLTRSITNELIDNIYDVAISNGALGGKISGAGGGGFFIFYCPGNTKYKVVDEITKKFSGSFKNYQFYKYGSISWRY